MITRRVFALGAAQGLLGLTLVGRLAQLGILESGKYKALSERNRIKMQVLIPKRGEIHDRTGQKLAINQPCFSLIMTPELCPHPKKTIHKIAKILEWDEEQLANSLKSLKNNPRFYALVLDRQMSWENLCRIAIHQNDLEGCEIQEGFARYYPFGEEMTHVLGYVQIPSAQEKLDNEIYRMADFRIGKVGIEKYADRDLIGKPGFKQMEVNARNQWVRDVESNPATDGNQLELTLSCPLQRFVAERLREYESASAVVMDITSGHILALHANPTYNPNYFINGISSQLWKDLMGNPYRPLHNKAIQGAYPPGSIFKVIVALAAFESGMVPLNFSTVCHGHMELGNHRFHCYKREGHGFVDIVPALRQSCDIYFYEIAKIIGIDRISAMARRFGLGEKTGVELPGEVAGLVPDKSWKKMFRGQSWTLGDTVQTGIGQGSLLATPIQLATVIGSVFSPGGVLLKPTLFKNSGQAPLESHGIDQKHIELCHQGLVDTVNSPQGTAFAMRIPEPELAYAGKTSTAQVRRITMEERRRGVLTNDQLPWKFRDHAMFCGYAPIHEPRYAVSVVIEHGGGGGRVASPVGRDILRKVQELERA